MEKGKEKEHNEALKEEVNKKFADLFKEIGNNRAQLSNQVLGVQRNLIKELNKDKVDDKRKKEILAEISRTEKMAAKQLPHLMQKLAQPTEKAKPEAKPKPKEAKAPKATTTKKKK